MTRRRPFPGSLRSAFRSRHVNTVARRTGTRQKLLKKFHPDGESLPLARFFSLPEQVYYGYPMKYELRLSDLVLQSTAKTSIRQKVDRFFHRWRRLAFRTFRLRPRRAKMSLTSRLTLLSAVMRRESCPPALGMNSSLTTGQGFMSGLNSTAIGHVMLVYPAICIWSLLPSLGVSRRDGYDIECFITRHAEGRRGRGQALSRTLFYPGDAVGSGSAV
ncbi:AraC family transcriptional regulator [Klebsiella pneumoniae]|nr:AraC family transcriptional regulator [Klebsiella pneumoniae]